jgi:hypothetical protein
MKKVLLSVAAVATLGLGMTSCGAMDTEAAAKQFCECKDTDDANKCYDEWHATYKDGKATEENSNKMASDMLECDPGGVVYVGSKVAASAE